MHTPKSVVHRCIHCGKKIDEENDSVTIKNTYSVPLKVIGDARLAGDSYREIKVIHCDSCHSIEREMINFRSRVVIHYPLYASMIWGVFFTIGWLISHFLVLQDLFLPFSVIISILLPVLLFLNKWSAIQEFLAREDLKKVHRLVLKNDYARLLPFYLVFSLILAIFFPIGIPVLLAAGVYYYVRSEKGKIEKECFFRRLPEQCKYCSGGTSFRRFRDVMIHYYRHSENCAIFLRGWEK